MTLFVSNDQVFDVDEVKTFLDSPTWLSSRFTLRVDPLEVEST